MKDVNLKVIINSLLIILAVMLSVTTLAYFVNITINNYTFILELFISFLIIYKIYNKDLNNKKSLLINLTIITLIILIVSMFSMNFYDLTWDGNTYHKNLIGLLKGGLNPLYNNTIGDEWMIHYANSYEILAAIFYATFNNIEAGKAIDILLSIVLFYNIYKFSYDLSKSKIKAILFSIPITFSPFLLSQFSAYYLDDIVAITLYLSILSLIKMIYYNDLKMNNKDDLIIYLCSTLICITLKFQAIFICGLFTALLGGYIVIHNFILKNYKNCFNNMLIMILIYLFGFVLVGSSSYMKNFFVNGNPFYPLLGGNVNLESDNEPEIFNNLYNRFEKFGYSIFANSSIDYANVKLKAPFTIMENEINDLYYPDLRIGGLGPWFSALILICFIIGVITLIYLIINKSVYAILLLLLMLGIILPINFLPIVWQFRYYPQIYLLPFIPLFILMIKNNKYLNIIYYLVIVIAIINVSFWIPSIFKKFEESKIVNLQLMNLANESLNKTILISDYDNYYFPGIFYNLQDKNINYSYIKKPLNYNNSINIKGLIRYEIYEEGVK